MGLHRRDPMSWAQQIKSMNIIQVGRGMSGSTWLSRFLELSLVMVKCASLNPWASPHMLTGSISAIFVVPKCTQQMLAEGFVGHHPGIFTCAIMYLLLCTLLLLMDNVYFIFQAFAYIGVECWSIFHAIHSYRRWI